MENPIYIAIDCDFSHHAEKLIHQLSPYVRGFKFGYQFILSCGLTEIQHMMCARENKVFLDLKLHDIPTTNKATLMAIQMSTQVEFVTVHIDNESDVDLANLIGYAEALGITLLGISYLSHTKFDCNKFENDVVFMTQYCGFKGMICPPDGICQARSLSKSLKLMVPGIRLFRFDGDDHRQTGSPMGVMNLGANYLVIGREVTQADDPVAAIKLVLDNLGIEHD